MQVRAAKILKNQTEKKNWNNFCGLMTILLVISSTSAAQQIDSVQVKKDLAKIKISPFFNMLSPFETQSADFSKKISTNLGNRFSHWGIICIGEYKWEQKTGIPLKVRLGSLEYVNKLEGKR